METSWNNITHIWFVWILHTGNPSYQTSAFKPEIAPYVIFIFSLSSEQKRQLHTAQSRTMNPPSPPQKSATTKSTRNANKESIKNENPLTKSLKAWTSAISTLSTTNWEPSKVWQKWRKTPANAHLPNQITPKRHLPLNLQSYKLNERTHSPTQILCAQLTKKKKKKKRNLTIMI